PGEVLRLKDVGGTYNLNVLLEMRDKMYIVRVYRPWITYERLAFLHAVKEALARSGLPVALPLATNTGETMLTYRNSDRNQDDERLAEIEPFIPHDHVADDWPRYTRAFGLMGRLHQDLASIELASTPFVAPPVSNYGTPDELVDLTQRGAEAIRQAMVYMSAAQLQGAQRALTICTEALQLLSLLQEWWHKEGERLPKQFTHGDYGGGNILFCQGQVVGILDFDFLDVRERIFDVAYALFWMFWRLEGIQVPAALAWSRVRDLLVSYNAGTSRPLIEQEVWALPGEIACVALYWVAEAYLLTEVGL